MNENLSFLNEIVCDIPSQHPSASFLHPEDAPHLDVSIETAVVRVEELVRFLLGSTKQCITQETMYAAIVGITG